jgi:hypothetical protein
MTLNYYVRTKADLVASMQLGLGEKLSRGGSWMPPRVTPADAVRGAGIASASGHHGVRLVGAIPGDASPQVPLHVQ